MRTALNLILPVALFTALTTNALLTLAGWKSASAVDENRPIAKRPEWNGSITSYIHGIDLWLTDNFAFRKPLLYSFDETLYSGFRSTLASSVVVGKGPWVFGGEFDGQHGFAPRHLAPAYIQKVKQALIDRKTWFEARGIHMLVLFMPTKASIYGNRYLPKSWRVDPSQPTQSEQVYEAMKDIMPESIVPVRSAILQASQTSQMYYHTDPHPTQNGTFVAFQQIAAHVAKYYPSLALPEYPPYSLKLDYLQPTTYGRMMGIPFKDESLVPVPNSGYSFTSPTPPAWASLLPEGSRLTYYENNKVKKLKAALIGDSFTNRMAAIFGETFSQAATVNINGTPDDPNSKFPAAFFDAFRPDFAVFLFVESRLAECGPGCGQFPITNPDGVRSP